MKKIALLIYFLFTGLFTSCDNPKEPEQKIYSAEKHLIYLSEYDYDIYGGFLNINDESFALSYSMDNSLILFTNINNGNKQVVDFGFSREISGLDFYYEHCLDNNNKLLYYPSTNGYLYILDYSNHNKIFIKDSIKLFEDINVRWNTILIDKFQNMLIICYYSTENIHHDNPNPILIVSIDDPLNPYIVSSDDLKKYTNFLTTLNPRLMMISNKLLFSFAMSDYLLLLTLINAKLEFIGFSKVGYTNYSYGPGENIRLLKVDLNNYTYLLKIFKKNGQRTTLIEIENVDGTLANSISIYHGYFIPSMMVYSDWYSFNIGFEKKHISSYIENGKEYILLAIPGYDGNTTQNANNKNLITQICVLNDKLELIKDFKISGRVDGICNNLIYTNERIYQVKGSL